MRNRTIWKYELPGKQINDVMMKSGAFILDIQLQQDPRDGSLRLCLWALVNPDSSCPDVMRRIEMHPTGQEINNTDELKHIKTLQSPGGLVWHFFERPL